KVPVISRSTVSKWRFWPSSTSCSRLSNSTRNCTTSTTPPMNTGSSMFHSLDRLRLLVARNTPPPTISVATILRTTLDSVSHANADHFMPTRSEEHTSELQSLAYLVCRLLLE